MYAALHRRRDEVACRNLRLLRQCSRIPTGTDEAGGEAPGRGLPDLDAQDDQK